VLDQVRVSRFGVVGNFNELLQGIEVKGGGGGGGGGEGVRGKESP
jgi:hypothetical protein